jgi:glycosyltransferase involved in cell wall biosynthesis
MLSAVVITNNASATIDKCLEALLRVTKDVVVVDSGSTDGTKEICLSKPVRYYAKEWEGYSANKNFGNEKAMHPYILSIDSDEILSLELIRSINIEFSGTSKLAEAYELHFMTNFAGKWIRYGSWNPEWHIRIFDKRKIQWKLMDVHEVLSVAPEHHVKKLHGNVEHYSYPTLDSHLQKIERYTDLFAERGFKAGVKSNAFKTLFSPLFTFVSSYILKLGFLDGYYGLIVARNNAFYTYKKYKKLAFKWENA